MAPDDQAVSEAFAAVDASVTVLEGPDQLTLGPHCCGCLALAGQIRIDGSLLPVGAFARGASGHIVLEPGARAVLVSLSDLPVRAQQRAPSGS